jgi:tRNA nucleotidyltransferase/poly(A) polymerase
MNTSIFPPEYFLRAVHVVQEAARESQQAVYLVGGFVRDLILGKLPADIDLDLLVDGDARPLAAHIGKALNAKIVFHDRFFTAKLSNFLGLEPLREIDFASSRSETYVRPGALPDVQLAPLQVDLGRRDFSVNALALELSDALRLLTHGVPAWQEVQPLVIDYWKGGEDLQNGLLRVLHERSFFDDPTRIFRAARYLTRLNWKLEEATQAQLDRALHEHAMDTLSPNRVYRELEKIFQEVQSAQTFQKLMDWGVPAVLGLLRGLDTAGFLADLRALDVEQLLDMSSKEELASISLFSWLPPEEREERFLPLGIGKKRIQAWSRELQSTSVRNTLIWKSALQDKKSSH